MRSNLKRIYDAKDKIDILTKPSYRFMVNPIYQVNKFILEIDKKITKDNIYTNLINNIEDLDIVTISRKNYKSDYDYVTNTIYTSDSKSDIFGLLHVASNDRTKKYTGIITDDGIGCGLNNGLTEVFTNKINNKRFSYLLEAIIADVLLKLDFKIMSHSYFKNAGNDVMLISKNLKELMVDLDSYHNNQIELITLYRERFARGYTKIRNSTLTQELDAIDYEISRLERANYSNVCNIFNILIGIINNSNLKDSEKLDLFSKLNNIFNSIFNNEEFTYLSGSTLEFEKSIYSMKRVK